MVSFQCEGCGDVQTKKKLDSHRSQCHAPFTCIDCMTTFRGTDYRAHTSCITEDQKYQGHLYRDKSAKSSKRKSVAILEPTENNALVPRKAYVEDEVDEVPPYVPTPPSAVPAKAIGTDSVFDYLVDDENPETPKVAYVMNKGEMSMKNNAPSVFSGRPSSRSEYRNKEERTHSVDYEANGYSYGAEPVKPRPMDINGSMVSLDFMTPSARTTRQTLDRSESYNSTHSRNNSNSEKKRKRGQNDDVIMADAPETVVRPVADNPGIAHSGLTGNLQRMVTTAEDPFGYPVSADSESDHGPAKGRSSRRTTKEEPQSPLKRTRRAKDEENGLGITIKGRAGRVKSVLGALNPANAEGAMVKTRRRASSSENVGSQTRGREGEQRERKKHRVHRHNGTSRDNVRMDHSRSKRRGSDDSPEGSRRRQKAIEYHKQNNSNSDSEEEQRQRGGGSQMVVFGEEERVRKKCEQFLAYATKGPDSEKGYSINKVLKRWHRDSEVRSTTAKHDAEKDLWKGLRLKRNDRGEIVIFF